MVKKLIRKIKTIISSWVFSLGNSIWILKIKIEGEFEEAEYMEKWGIRESPWHKSNLK